MLPNFIQDPKTGMPAPDRIHCKKCIKYGDINAADEPDECLRTIARPCTICAVANGGWWGWGDEEGDNTEGSFPGRDGISDALSNHSTYENPEDDFRVPGVTRGVELLAPDYQVILGFVQYAHYNHLRWVDIIDPSGSPDMDEYMDEDTTENNWYWWKLIPKNLSLTKAHINTLSEMIIRYKVDTPPDCVPKTHQNISGTLSDDLWPDFWNTFVEPSHVAWVYRQTMGKVLSAHREKVSMERLLRLAGQSRAVQPTALTQAEGELNTLLKKDISDFEMRMIRPTHVEQQDWVADLLPDTISSISEDFRTSPHDEPRAFFLTYDGTLPLWRSGEHLKIRDRDIFGGYLDVLVVTSHPYFDYGWLQDMDGAAQNPDGYLKTPVEFWNTPTQEDFKSLFDNVYKIIGFEDTSYWDDVQRVIDERVVSDYTNELYYRQYLEEDGEIWSDTPDSAGFDYSEREEMVGKLKEIQTIVDENVKDSVEEGVYLDIMNKMCDMYRLVKNSQ